MDLVEILHQLFVACALDFNLKPWILAKFYLYVLIDWMILWPTLILINQLKKHAKNVFL